MAGSPNPVELSAVTAALRDAPEFLAGWLARTPDGESLLRDRLSLSDTQLHRLLACRAPNPRTFLRDVQVLAGFIRAPETSLAAALREAGALAAMTTLPDTVGDATSHLAPGLVAAARDGVVELMPGSAASVRVRALAASTWGAAPESVRLEGDVEAAVVWASSVVVVSMPNLTLASADRWLVDWGVPSSLPPEARESLRGLLVARRGYAVILLDATMTAAERRFTLAHEHGHFLLDYQLARQRILRDAPELLQVIDGQRPPTDGDRAKASLARVPIGLHTHLLHRDLHGGADILTTGAEDGASLYAMELLAPWESLLQLLRTYTKTNGAHSAQLRSATTAVESEFGLPQDVAMARAAAGLEALGIKRGFFDR